MGGHGSARGLCEEEASCSTFHRSPTTLSLSRGNMRRCCSTPSLPSCRSVESYDDSLQLDVFVVQRQFAEFGKGSFLMRLPESVKSNLLPDLGVCHYMTVFRTSDGSLFQVCSFLDYSRIPPTIYPNFVTSCTQPGNQREQLNRAFKFDQQTTYLVAS